MNSEGFEGIPRDCKVWNFLNILLKATGIDGIPEEFLQKLNELTEVRQTAQSMGR